MARAEPTFAWTLPPAPLAPERARPVTTGDGGAPQGWGIGVSVVVHAVLVALIGTLALAERLDTPEPVFEVTIAAPPADTAAAAPGTLSSEQASPPVRAPAPESPPVESAGLVPPSPPPTPPEAEPTPEPEVQPEPAPVEVAKPAEPPPKRQRKPEPPRPRPAPPPQVASKSAPPTETPDEARAAVPQPRDTILKSTIPGVTASGRDTKVTALVEVKPVYPKIALQLGEEGTVILTIEISDGGQVTDATVLQTSGFGSLDQAAIKAARGWRFQAAMQDGRAVASTVNIPFRFKFKRNQ